MDLFLFRLASGFVAIGLAQWLSFPNLVAVIFSLTISHNILAFVYSESQRTHLTRNWRNHIFPLSVVALLISITCALDRPPVYFLFAIHHICNETYFAQEKFQQRSTALVASRAFLHFFAYFGITRTELKYFGWELPISFWGTALAVSVFAYLFLLYRNKNTFWKNDAAYELVVPAFFAISLFTKSATLDHVLVYHFIFWAVYPVQRLAKQGKLLQYCSWTIGLTIAGGLFTPLGPHWGGLDVAGLSYITRLTAFFHFFSSFALSRAHPHWIKRWFFPQPNTACGGQIQPNSSAIGKTAA